MAAGLGVQRAFEDGAENGRRNAAPVEAATLGEDELARRRVDGRDGDGLGEEAAVDVLSFFFIVCVAGIMTSM